MSFDWDKKLFTFDPVSGRINASQQGGIDNSVIEAYESDGLSARFFDHSGLDIHDVFVHRDKMRQREPLRARLDKNVVKADGMDECKIVGVPAGATVTIAYADIEISERCDGSTVHLSFDMPGVHTVHIEAFPYLPQQFQITAVP